MTFDGTEGEEITLSEGATLTAAYRDAFPTERKGHFFGKDILQDLLTQEGCMGIRIYHGLDAAGQRELVLVGADAHGNDMISLVADKALPCPSYCSPKSNPLNS